LGRRILICMQPEPIVDYQCTLGEGPLWHPSQRRLYWVDIDRGRLFWFDPSTGESAIAYEGPEPIGGFTLQADGSLLLFMAAGNIRTFRDGRLTDLLNIPEESDSRFNDVAADPAGRIFAGTMRTDSRGGRLWLIEPDGSYRLVLENRGTPNGIAFMADERTMLFTDSGDAFHSIYSYQYDRSTGQIDNPTTIFQPEIGEGKPDGLTVDREDHIWSATWNGGCVWRLTPDGNIVDQIKLPANKVTSMAFGGPDYRDLYISTAGGPQRDKADQSGAGKLFRVKTEIEGKPEYFSRIGLG
jgi:D-xylono/L-arabinono-1,4-lactonase